MKNSSSSSFSSSSSALDFRPETLDHALARLDSLAFQRRARCGPLIERFHSLSPQISASPYAREIWNLHDWLLVPLSVWPVDLPTHFSES